MSLTLVENVPSDEQASSGDFGGFDFWPVLVYTFQVEYNFVFVSISIPQIRLVFLVGEIVKEHLALVVRTHDLMLLQAL